MTAGIKSPENVIANIEDVYFDGLNHLVGVASFERSQNREMF